MYPDLTSDAVGGLLGAVTARAEAQVLRLSLLYALLDTSRLIEPAHLAAALECWRYSEDSARYVFGDALGDPVADEIMHALATAPDGLTRSEIRELFSRNLNSGRIGAALSTLLTSGRAAVTMESPVGAGRPSRAVAFDRTTGRGKRHKRGNGGVMNELPRQPRLTRNRYREIAQRASRCRRSSLHRRCDLPPRLPWKMHLRRSDRRHRSPAATSVGWPATRRRRSGSTARGARPARRRQRSVRSSRRSGAAPRGARPGSRTARRWPTSTRPRR